MKTSKQIYDHEFHQNYESILLFEYLDTRIKKISIYFGAQIHEFGGSTTLKYPFHQMNGEIILKLHSLKHLGHLLKTIWYLKLLQSDLIGSNLYVKIHCPIILKDL